MLCVVVAWWQVVVAMSTYGVKGEASRCFPFWQAFSQCIADSPDPRVCKEAREDYLECLHHTKEVSE